MKGDDAVLPQGWEADLHARADLERSFMALRGIRHFYADAWRGRIRAEQLRFDAAWRYFDRAFSLAEEVEERIPSVVQQCFLNHWALEAALAQDLVKKQINDYPERWIRRLPDEVYDGSADVRLLFETQRRSEAMLLLHLGQYRDAVGIYEELLEKGKADTAGEVALCHLGLAACEWNMEFREKALRSLENAGLAIAAAGSTYAEGKAVAVLLAFYRFLKKEDDAASWEAFFVSLPCSKETRVLLARRARLVLERCEKEGRVVVV